MSCHVMSCHDDGRGTGRGGQGYLSISLPLVDESSLMWMNAFLPWQASRRKQQLLPSHALFSAWLGLLSACSGAMCLSSLRWYRSLSTSVGYGISLRSSGSVRVFVFV